MNGKQTIGLVLLSIGIVLILFAFYKMGVVSEKKQEIAPITSSPISPTERMPEERVQFGVGTPDEAMWILIGGIAMAVVGTGIAIWFRERFGA